MDDIAKHDGILIKERIQNAETAVRAYLQYKGENADAPLCKDDISDLLADMWHLADALGVAVEDVNDSARMHYEAEKEDAENYDI